MGRRILSNLHAFGFKFGKTNEKEEELRELFGKAMGINVLPEYINYKASVDLQKGFVQSFESKFKAKWRDVLLEGNYKKEQIPLLFTIVAHQNNRMKTKQTQEWYDKLLLEYKALH